MSVEEFSGPRKESGSYPRTILTTLSLSFLSSWTPQGCVTENIGDQFFSCWGKRKEIKFYFLFYSKTTQNTTSLPLRLSFHLWCKESTGVRRLIVERGHMSPAICLNPFSIWASTQGRDRWSGPDSCGSPAQRT